VSSKLVRADAPLGAAPSSARIPVPKSVDACILFPPPGLFQRELYLQEEGLFACWATAAEMIVKHRSPTAKFVRPRFRDLLPSGPEGSDELFQSQVKYMDFVDQTRERMGFQLLPGRMLYPWDLTTLASWLHSRGPLMFDGHFFRVASSGASIHCVVVFGAQDGIVYYRDPGDDNKLVQKMSMDQLVAKAHPKNKTPWALGSSRFDLTPVR
jgi:hypothetical protein